MQSGNLVLDNKASNGIIRNMSNNEDKKIDKMAGMFKALSNENRLKIYMKLAACCPPKNSLPVCNQTENENCNCVGELGQEVDIAPSTLSHHLKELRQAGLITMQRHGQRIESRVDEEHYEALRNFFS